MRRWRLSSMIAPLALAAALLAPSSAAAVPATFQPCIFAILNMDCTTITVPTDRSGTIAGTSRIQIVKSAAAEGPRLGTLVFLAGGPGQSTTPILGELPFLLDGAQRYDLVAMDQRGTGLSEVLRCPRLESAFNLSLGAKFDQITAVCADQLGAARASYTTAESVEDLEAVRDALGVDKLMLFGVSYGTKLALAYAQAHPTHVQGLLLDSTLPVNEPTAFSLSNFTAMRRALNELCSTKACRKFAPDPVAAVAKAARRAARSPLEGDVFNTEGIPKPAELSAVDLLDSINGADLNPYIWEQLIGAIYSANHGDPAPLLRLAPQPDDSERVKAHSWRKDYLTASTFSTALNVAMNCEDAVPPWTRGVTTGRQAAIDAAGAAIADATFLPFTRKTVLDDSLAAYCRGWPESPATPTIPGGGLPNVPVLALNGQLDLRTPQEDVPAALATDPQAQLVNLPFTGHSTVTTDVSGCALSLARRFLIFGVTSGRCSRMPEPVPVRPPAPLSVNSVEPLPGSCRAVKSKRSKRKHKKPNCLAIRKTITAGYLAFRDALEQVAAGWAQSGGGLRGGSWEALTDFDDETFEETLGALRLDGAEYVPGAFTFGRIELRKFPRVSGSISISGPAGAGNVRFSGFVAPDRSIDKFLLRLTGKFGRVKVKLGGSRNLSASAAAKVWKPRNWYRHQALSWTVDSPSQWATATPRPLIGPFARTPAKRR